MHPLEDRLWARLAGLAGCSIDQVTGDGSQYPATIGLIDDSDAPNASNFNVSPEGLADRTEYTVLRVALAGWDWHSSILLSGLFGTTCWGGAANYAADLNAFLFAYSTLAGQVVATQTIGADDALPLAWNQIGTGSVHSGASETARGISVDPNGSDFWCAVEIQSSSEVLIQHYSSGTGNWTTARTVSLATGPVAMTVFNSYLVYVTSQGIISSTANQGTTWADTNTGLDFGIARVAQSPTVCVLGTGTSIVYWSTDGVTWTEVTLTPGNNHIMYGLAWDPTRSLFVAVFTQEVAPFTAQIWTSPDGNTWTEAGFGPTGQWIVDFAILQGDWVATLLDVSNGGPSGQVWSGDGGNTWFLGKASHPTNATTSTNSYSSSRLASSPTQLLTFNSLWARFSRLAGVPPTHL